MLTVIAPDLWHLPYNFVVNGVPISSRMTVVRLKSGGLWLHSPVPLSGADRQALEAEGKVEYAIAPNKAHHLFVPQTLAAFPEAKFFGAPGLREKRPDLPSMTELTSRSGTAWSDDLDQLFFDGMPLGNETVWFHKSSKTLIVTDLCQWWQGELPFGAKAYAWLNGVRQGLAVPRIVRWMVKDPQAARRSAEKILQWPIERVVVAHNAIIERNAHQAVTDAFACFTVPR
jgi:hypothetical protein